MIRVDADGSLTTPSIPSSAGVQSGRERGVSLPPRAAPVETSYGYGAPAMAEGLRPPYHDGGVTFASAGGRPPMGVGSSPSIREGSATSSAHTCVSSTSESGRVSPSGSVVSEASTRVDGPFSLSKGGLVETPKEPLQTPRGNNYHTHFKDCSGYCTGVSSVDGCGTARYRFR